MKLRTDYAVIIEDLIEKHGSVKDAIEKTGIARTTFYDIKNGTTEVPRADTYIRMIAELER